MLLGIGLFGLLDAISKLLSAGHTAWQVLLVRFCTMLAVLVLLRAIRPGWGGALRTRFPRIHAARTAAMLCSATGFFLAFSHLPLVEGYLVFFTSPFFVLALAALTLGEAPRAAAWLWVAVGFGGVAVGLAPGLLAGLSGPLIGYAWALFGTVAYSFVFVLNRALRHEPGIARLLFWPALAGIVVMLVPGLLHWRAPDFSGWSLMIANGAIVAAATVCLAEAFRHAPASRLAPFGYSGLVWSVCFDLLLWGHAPGWALVVGAAIVVWACAMSERASAGGAAEAR
jgi:drug/metabolite transporter (DMT)-like permease